MANVVTPGMGRVLAALGGNNGKAPVIAAETNLRSPEMQARAAYRAELAEKIVGIVKAGVDPEIAAGACGIGKRKFGWWIKLGLEDEEPFASFKDKLDVALSGFEALLVAGISQRAKEDANLALRLLERRFPERWSARNESANLTVNVQQNQITPVEARVKMRELFGELAAPLPEDGE